MRTRELILALIIIGYLVAVFSFLVIEYEVQFQNYEPEPMQMVELFGNGSARSFEMENPPISYPSIFASMGMSAMRFFYALPFAIAGIGLIFTPIGFLQTHLFVPPEGFRLLVFWTMAIITIPLSFLLSKDVSLWRRILYIYVLAAIISGTPMILNENFGQ